MNIYGIRSGRRTNKFDDIIGVTYRNEYNAFRCEYPCTLDPGLPWLLSPMDPGGAAAIYPGQYRGVWQMGSFRGRRALLQIRPITVYRDNNKDAVFDYNPDSRTIGMYGIFAHPHFQRTVRADNVGTSSAGCPAFASDLDINHFFSVLDLQFEHKMGNIFTFTLFEK